MTAFKKRLLFESRTWRASLRTQSANLPKAHQDSNVDIGYTTGQNHTDQYSSATGGELMKLVTELTKLSISEPGISELALYFGLCCDGISTQAAKMPMWAMCDSEPI